MPICVCGHWNHWPLQKDVKDKYRPVPFLSTSCNFQQKICQVIDFRNALRGWYPIWEILDLPAWPGYHIEFKEDYTTVRNPPHSAPVWMQDACEAQLQRSQHEMSTWSKPLHRMGQLWRTSTKTKWTYQPVDSRNLNLAIKRNPYDMRTLYGLLEVGAKG